MSRGSKACHEARKLVTRLESVSRGSKACHEGRERVIASHLVFFRAAVPRTRTHTQTHARVCVCFQAWVYQIWAHEESRGLLVHFVVILLLFSTMQASAPSLIV